MPGVSVRFWGVLCSGYIIPCSSRDVKAFDDFISYCMYVNYSIDGLCTVSALAVRQLHIKDVETNVCMCLCVCVAWEVL